MDMLNLDFKGWLERSLRTIYERKPQAMCLAAIDEEGNVITAYFDSSAQDKVATAGAIQMDAVMQAIRVNGHILREALEAEDDPACEAGEE